MNKAILYACALIIVLVLPLAKVNSQEQKQQKKPSVSMDTDDVAASRSNGGASTVRKGATNQFGFRSTGGDFIGQDKARIYTADEGWFKVKAEYLSKTKDVK